MKFSVRIARIMLIIALLPWGAYSGASRLPMQIGSPAAAFTPADTRQVAQSIAVAHPSPETSAQLMAPARRCKTGVLTGFGCAPDVVLGAAASIAPPPEARLGQSAQTRGGASLLGQAPPRRPPRIA